MPTLSRIERIRVARAPACASKTDVSTPSCHSSPFLLARGERDHCTMCESHTMTKMPSGAHRERQSLVGEQLGLSTEESTFIRLVIRGFNPKLKKPPGP